MHGLCFQDTFQPRRSTVEFKYLTSRCLVQVLCMCVGFFPLWGCFVLSYKGEICWQVKWEVHRWTFFLFRSYALSGSRSGGLAYLTYPRSQCCRVRVCFCELSLWGSNRFLSSIWLWTSNLFGKSYWCSLGGESSCWFSQLCFGNAWYLSQLERGLCCLFEFRVI